MAAPGSGLTLREQLLATERACIELADHLDLAMVLQVVKLKNTTANFGDPDEAASMPDSTVRAQTLIVSASNDFAREILDRLETLLSVSSTALDASASK